MNVLPFAKRVQAIALLVEGCSIRGVSRLMHIHQDTIGRLALAVGEGCTRLHDAIMRDLKLEKVQLDEQHSYVHTRQINIVHNKTTRPPEPEHGEQWTFAALDVASRAVVAWLVGRRSLENTNAVVAEVRQRLAEKKNLAGDRELEVKPMIATDGLNHYPTAVELAFGTEVAFGQLVKLKEKDKANDNVRAKVDKMDQSTASEHYKYALPVPLTGNPNVRDINTSYIERMNLTTRTCQRRFMRKTAGSSKKLRNHRAAVALQYTFYNLARVHDTLTDPVSTTPAMKLGVTDHVWTMAELVERALHASPAPPLPPIVPKSKPNLPQHSRWYGVPPDRAGRIRRVRNEA